MTIWTLPPPSSGEPAYLRVLRVLERGIESKELATGDRLPTHRQLAETLGLSVGTISRVYAEAESRGLVHGEVGRGTFVGRRPAEHRFPTAGTPGIDFDLAVTWPLHALDPDLGSALLKIGSQHDVRSLLRYPPHAGFMRHREAGAAWAKMNGIDVAPEQVLICCGVQHAIHVALSTLAGPGEWIAAEALTYPGLKAAARALHLRLSPVQMDDEGIVPESFEAVCRLRCPKVLYTIPTIQNPTGGILGEGRRRQIAEIAGRHGVAILEDDVHRMLERDPPTSFFTLAPEITYSAVSISKVVAGGLRIAFLLAPPSATTALADAIWATSWMAAPLTAEVAATWIDDGTAAATVVRKREEAGRRQQIAREIFHGHAVRGASHAYHFWLPLPGRWTAPDLALAAHRAGVAVTPSGEFAVGRESVERAVRVSLSSVPTREELRRGLKRLHSILEGPPPASAVL